MAQPAFTKPRRLTKKCVICDTEFLASRSDKLTCGPKCRKAKSRTSAWDHSQRQDATPSLPGIEPLEAHANEVGMTPAEISDHLKEMDKIIDQWLRGEVEIARAPGAQIVETEIYTPDGKRRQKKRPSTIGERNSKGKKKTRKPTPRKTPKTKGKVTSGRKR